MARPRKGKHYRGPKDPEYLNELISLEREPRPTAASILGWNDRRAGESNERRFQRLGVTVIDAQTFISPKKSWFVKLFFDGEIIQPVDWHSDACWPELMRDGGMGLEWDAKQARVYFINADLPEVRGTDVGDVVCRAWARMKGILRCQ